MQPAMVIKVLLLKSALKKLLLNLLALTVR